MASFSSFALLSSFVSTANLRCLLATTFSSLSFLSNSFSSPCFNLLRVARCCFWWSSVSDDPFFFLLYFFGSFLLYPFQVLSSAYHSSVLQSLKLCFPRILAFIFFVDKPTYQHTYRHILEKWFPLQGERTHYLNFFVCMLIERKRRKGRQNNNRLINLPKVITFFTDYKYTT